MFPKRGMPALHDFKAHLKSFGPRQRLKAIRLAQFLKKVHQESEKWLFKLFIPRASRIPFDDSTSMRRDQNSVRMVVGVFPPWDLELLIKSVLHSCDVVGELPRLKADRNET